MKNKALAAPYLVWMALFTIVPLAIVAYYAFTDASTGEFTLANLEMCIRDRPGLARRQ